MVYPPTDDHPSKYGHELSELNSRPDDHKSDALTTIPSSHVTRGFSHTYRHFVPGSPLVTFSPLSMHISNLLRNVGCIGKKKIALTNYLPYTRLFVVPRLFERLFDLLSVV